MIRALKMTAARIAERGDSRRMTLMSSSTGKTPMNIAGMMAKYLATSLATENVVSAPRVISSCLPISTISISFVGSESRSTMLPASLAACVPVFIATPTSAWASAGASLVPSPVMAISRPPDCSFLISAILSSGVASARKSSTPASVAIARAVSGLSPVIITVRMPIARSSSKRVRMPSLTTSLRWITPSARHTPVRVVELGDAERGAAVAGDAVGDRVERLRNRSARLEDPALDGVGGALADAPPVVVDTAHPRLGGERDEGGVEQVDGDLAVVDSRPG